MMKKYLFDTCVFRKLLDHFPKKGVRFETVWEQIDNGFETGELVSVDECYNELCLHYDEKNPNYAWIKLKKPYFLGPSNDESIIIKQLFTNPKMQESIHVKNILENRPSADVYIAAKAKQIGAIVVTVEKFKPNSAQLPNICESLGVATMSFDDFMGEYIK
jgi:hypothetical protein